MPLTEADFTWDFLLDTFTSWPMAHILTPFMIQMVFQSKWFTLFCIFFFESVEVFFVTVFQGDYVIFVGDDSEIEPITDSLLGDVFQGFLGIGLATLVILVFRIPPWMPSYFNEGARGLWVKRILQFAMWLVVMSSTNMQIVTPGAARVNVGQLFVMLWTPFMIYVFYQWNWTERERELVWHSRTRREYERAFMGWAATTLFIITSTSLHVWYSYFQTWVGYAMAVAFNLWVLYTDGRMWELQYALNLGFGRDRYRGKRHVS